MRILLTGGSGMVGKNFLEHPSACNHAILAPSSNELDLLDISRLETWMSDKKPDLVVHTAGKVGGIEANIREPVKFLTDNLIMGKNIALTSRKLSIKKLINLGSSCMYPRHAENPLKEDALLKGELEPTNEGYALAKITIAKLCEYISREDNNFQFKTLVPCNIFGRHDKFDPSHSHMIPAVIHKLHQAKINGINNIDIWGDGTARREFMYAGDLADCIWQSIDKLHSLPNIMNVGLGQDLSINEYYQAVAKVVGYEGKFGHDLSKPIGMKQKLVDIKKSSSWGWQACTPLKLGLEKTYEFYLGELKS